MTGETPEEWHLLSFFEVEPTLLDSHVPWCYNDALYEVQQGGLRISFAISPACRDVRIKLELEGHRLYEFNALTVQDVRYRNERGIEELVLVLSELEEIVLRMKPHFEIRRNFKCGM